MCFRKKILLPPKPSITFYEAPQGSIGPELRALNIKILYPLDSQYFYTTTWGYGQAVDYIRRIHSFPPYAAEKFDCDDFAILLKALLSEYFGLSAVGIAIGETATGGAHAFNYARAESGWITIEPQTGQIVTDYKINHILL